jgi:uncharacterized protein (TIGR03067 family)
MRSMVFIFLTLFGFGCASTKHTNRESNKYNGTWIPIKQEIGGILLPHSAFEKQKLIIYDSSYTVFAESVDKGILKFKDNKMDIFGKDGVNAGKHFTALYKYDNEQLTVCYNLLGDSYPESYETNSKPTLFLSVYRRETVK